MAIVLLIVLPPILAMVLKSARLPGWSVLGGLLAGIMLGPTILGRVMPDRFETVFLGGASQRQVMDDLLHEQDRDRVIALQTRAGEEYRLAMIQRHEVARAEAQESLDEARATHQVPIRVMMGLIVILTMLGAVNGRVQKGDERQGLIAPMTIGLWAALVPGGIAFASLYWLWPKPIEMALLAGAALAIGPWILSVDDVVAADHAEFGGAHMIQRAGRFASIAALIIAIWACYRGGGQTALLWSACLLAFPLSWFLPALKSRTLKHLLEFGLLPILATLVMLRIDLNRHADLWLIVLFILLSGDGRWLGALLGAMSMGGRHSLRTMRLVLGTMSSGPTMLAVTLIGIETGLLTESVALALAMGVATIELTAPTRRVVARQLVQTEEEIEEIKNQE